MKQICGLDHAIIVNNFETDILLCERSVFQNTQIEYIIVLIPYQAMTPQNGGRHFRPLLSKLT